MRTPTSILCLLFAFVVAVAPVRASAAETAAKYAYVVDARTGAVLMEKNAAEPMAPASMTKLMTIYLTFERLKDGRLKLDSELPVTEEAWRTGGSKSFVSVGAKVRVEDLIRGIIVQSGNDASIVVAQAIAGSEAAFAAEMNKKAKELGLTGSNFRNSTGWPDPEHVSTARDLAILAKRTIQDFPEHYKYYAETEFAFGGIRQANRNPLLYKNMGADGLKTGHTETSGYGLTASAARGERRLILVVNGLSSDKERGDESQRLMEWGFNEFDNYGFFKAGETIESAEVWQGRAASVPLVVEKEVLATLPKAARDKLKVSAQYSGPIPAPIAKGQRIATLVLEAPGMSKIELPLVAGADVERKGFFGRMMSSARQMLGGGTN
jgi:D-alanyl-D-alanine carboxypeptidase (penicillin-binding protein 5/6)